jgi:Cu(I)-responsive transcriptional regulator
MPTFVPVRWNEWEHPMKPAEMMTIGEAAAHSGVPPKTIRFYEEAGIIKPAARGENRYRAYGDADLHTLRFVHRARHLGFPLKDVAALLELYQNTRRTSRDVKKLALRHVAELDRKIAELTAIRDTIAMLAEQCHGDHRPECPILDELSASTH